ncbi:gamma-glutamylcyclotransferase family protein [Alkalihalobacillus sp. 1P02AB]|uniref:gamma-glutamylcyclotransferase family protein n=1 Tax=Alkalihalobacillus sp. 1P02AB TaxID=3132260 RepID=UPI0039A5A504
MPYYFAYGSCMDLKDIARDVVAEVVGPAKLNHYRLAFTKYSENRQGGVADIITAPMDYLEGIVFKVADFKGLDRREGAPSFYKRIVLPVELYNEKRFIDVSTYTIVQKEVLEIKPSAEYAGLIRSGATLLSKEYREKLEEILTEERYNVD